MDAARCRRRLGELCPRHDVAAMRGNQEAIRLRREIADQMSEVEIATAQRAARAWLKTN